MRLDESQPYAEVHGGGCVRYEQNGRMFLPNGREVGAPDDGLDDVLAEAPSGASSYQAMHWKTLKALVESYGGTWENKEAAIRFLEGNAG